MSTKKKVFLAVKNGDNLENIYPVDGRSAESIAIDVDSLDFLKTRTAAADPLFIRTSQIVSVGESTS